MMLLWRMRDHKKRKNKMELKLKGLDEVGRKQLKRRTGEVFRSVEELAKKENVSVACILGFLLTRFPGE